MVRRSVKYLLTQIGRLRPGWPSKWTLTVQGAELVQLYSENSYIEKFVYIVTLNVNIVMENFIFCAVFDINLKSYNKTMSQIFWRKLNILTIHIHLHSNYSLLVYLFIYLFIFIILPWNYCSYLLLLSVSCHF